MCFRVMHGRVLHEHVQRSPDLRRTGGLHGRGLLKLRLDLPLRGNEVPHDLQRLARLCLGSLLRGERMCRKEGRWRCVLGEQRVHHRDLWRPLLCSWVRMYPAELR